MQLHRYIANSYCSKDNAVNSLWLHAYCCGLLDAVSRRHAVLVGDAELQNAVSQIALRAILLELLAIIIQTKSIIKMNGQPSKHSAGLAFK